MSGGFCLECYSAAQKPGRGLPARALSGIHATNSLSSSCLSLIDVYLHPLLVDLDSSRASNGSLLDFGPESLDNTRMFSAALWTGPVAYFLCSLFSASLFHRVWSTSILALVLFIEAASSQRTWIGAAFYWLLALLDCIICLSLSPAQAYLKREVLDEPTMRYEIWSKNTETAKVE